jgi:DNA-binding transcriptional regulator WhiA
MNGWPKTKVPLNNYLDLLINEKMDSITNCPICVDGIHEVIAKIYDDLKQNYQEKNFQRTLKKLALSGIYSWKQGRYPIPIVKLKKLLLFWRDVCNLSDKDLNAFYDVAFQKATSFKAFKSPVNIKTIKCLDSKLSYLIGIIYADGSLSNCWKTLKKKGKFRFEISITDESKENLEFINKLLKGVFGIKTNVKTAYNGRWYRILFSSSILHRLLNAVFEMPMGYKKGKLKLPKIILSSNVEIKKYFLKGFFISTLELKIILGNFNLPFL